MDFNNVQFLVQKVMRYDTLGDWTLIEKDELTISAWEGLGEISARAVQLHEFLEAVILLAAGIAPEEIDILDDFKNKIGIFAERESHRQSNLLLEACLAAEAVPVEKRNLYAQAHNLALLVERMFVEAGGGNWQEHDAMIEAYRGKIPYGG